MARILYAGEESTTAAGLDWYDSVGMLLYYLCWLIFWYGLGSSMWAYIWSFASYESRTRMAVVRIVKQHCVKYEPCAKKRE